MELKIKVEGVDEFVKNLRDLGVNRIPNYVSRSLTEIANRAQDSMIAEASTQLTTRGTWLRKGTRYGINRKAATKNDLTAEVSSIAPWLVTQETQTVHTPQGSGRLAIPTKWIRPSRLNTELISKAMRPRNLKRTFLLEKNGRSVIMQRTGSGVTGTLVPMYVLKARAPFQSRIHLEKNAMALVNRIASPVMTQMIEQAISEKG